MQGYDSAETWWKESTKKSLLEEAENSDDGLKAVYNQYINNKIEEVFQNATEMDPTSFITQWTLESSNNPLSTRDSEIPAMTSNELKEQWGKVVAYCKKIKTQNDAIINRIYGDDNKDTLINIKDSKTECQPGDTVEINLNCNRYVYVNSDEEGLYQYEGDTYHDLQGVDGSMGLIRRNYSDNNIKEDYKKVCSEVKDVEEGSFDYTLPKIIVSAENPINKQQVNEEERTQLNRLFESSEIKTLKQVDEKVATIKEDDKKKYTLKIGEECTQKELYVIIPFRCYRFIGEYDVWEEQGVENTAGPAQMLHVKPHTELFEKYKIIKIDIAANVSINQYIHSVDGNEVEYLKEEDSNWKLKVPTEKGTRSTWDNDKKGKQPAILENGTPIVYKVKVTNEGKRKVYVKIKDTLPEIIKGNEIKIKRGNTIKKLTGQNRYTIKETDWPGADKGFLEIDKEGSITFTITATVNATSTNANYYKPDNPLKATAEITKVATAKEDDKEIANIGKPKKSSDYFTLKQYDVSVDTYISKINRADGGKLQKNEYIVADDKYSAGGNRKGKENADKKENPIFIENGDIVTYKIVVKNGAKNSDPYFAPKKVTVNLTDTLPITKSEVISEEEGKKKVTAKNSSQDESKLGYQVDKENSRQITFDEFDLAKGESMTITLRVRINNSQNTTLTYDSLRTNTAKITNVTNIYEKSTKDKKIKNCNSKKSSADYFRVKNYNVAIDKYIEKVEHKEGKQPELATYNSKARKSTKDEEKDGEKTKSPVYVECGDEVTYKIRVYNTTKDAEYNIGNRKKEPYQAPQYVSVDIEDILPNKYSNLNIKIDGQTIVDEREEDSDEKSDPYDITEKEKEPELKDETSGNEEDSEETGNGDENIIEDNDDNDGDDKENVDNEVNEDDEEEQIEHDEGISSEDKEVDENIDISNNAQLLKDVKVAKDGVTEITVTLTVEEVKRENKETNKASIKKVRNINGYAVKNHSNRLEASDVYKLNDYNVSVEQSITGYGAEMLKYNNMYSFTKEEEKFEGKVEKYETLIVTTIVKNNATDGEKENNTGSWKKYNTRVCPEISRTMSDGLKPKSVEIKWHKTNGKTQKVEVGEKVILLPGEWLEYITTVEVTESNLYMGKLNINSQIGKLLNVNGRDVTEQNIAKQKEGSDNVTLKDVVIAGNVWIDENRSGIKDTNEEGKSGIIVKLYKVGEKNPISTKKTGQNGFYTFGRQPRADSNGNYYQYYVEFEYDGVKYKATEVYGGDNDGEADGMQNLGGREGSKIWRQGHADIPGTTSGNKEYMTDSNAYEFDDVRKDFNKGYETIGFNKSYSGEAEIVSVNTLSYEKEGHKSTLKSDANRKIRARSFIKQSYENKVNENNGNTNLLYLYGYEGYSNQYPETEYLKFINLGLVEREEVDISLDADVYSVKTTINGEEMTYSYGKNDADSTSDNYQNQANAYKLSKELAEKYNLDLYTSDYYYRYDNYYDEKEVENHKKEGSELNTEVTYRIRVTNNAIKEDEPGLKNEYKDIKIDTAINELAIYYDANFMEPGSTTKVSKKNEDTGLLEEKSQPSTRVTYGESKELKLYENSIYGNKAPTDLKEKGYNVVYLRGMNDYIPEGESRYVEITFTIAKEKREEIERCLKITEDEDMGLELISEISAYTTKYSDSCSHKGMAGEYAGLVDRDSNPGNLGIHGKSEDYPNYEDDTYKVGIKVGLLNEPPPETPPPPGTPEKPISPERSITGMVWDDARSEKIGDSSSGVQYLGNGQYNYTVGVTDYDKNDKNAKTNPDEVIDYDRDKPIEGVKVSLIEVVQTKEVDRNGNAIYYECPAQYTYDVYQNGEKVHSKGEKIETRTDQNGEYQLNHFIPGYYKVRFDYGDDKELKTSIIYNGQDYKSTQYYNEGYYEGNYNGDNIGKKLNFKYFDKVREALRKPERFSDAQDDEIRRLNVNSYSETMTALQAVVFAEKESNKERLTKNTHMFAESTIFYVKPEEVDSETTKIDPIEDYINKGKDFNQERLWRIQNLDFGIEYRPEASIILDKKIATVELVTSDGEVLIELYFKDEKQADGSTERVMDPERSRGYENVQYLPNKDKELQGFIYINMDTEILEGATIKVEYEMTGENNSEVDRVNRNLDTIKYEVGANSYGDYKVYARNNVGTTDGDEKNIEYTYNANATASQLLGSVYYDNYQYNNGEETYNYLKKLKKSYRASENTPISNVTLEGEEYYGMYLGETYYTGKIGNRDTVAELKIDHILDYIDNDFTFSQKENSTKNRLWKTTTSKQLYENNMLDWRKVNVEKDENGERLKKDGYYNLVDKFGIRYDTKNKTNLALSVDDNKGGNADPNRNGNISLSKFLRTNKESLDDKEEYTGTISAMATKVISADDTSVGKGLSYENIAEVVQYTSLTGRRTTLPDGEGNGGIIGNADTGRNWTGYKKWEEDTDATEVITISPPTGLRE